MLNHGGFTAKGSPFKNAPPFSADLLDKLLIERDNRPENLPQPPQRPHISRFERNFCPCLRLAPDADTQMCFFCVLYWCSCVWGCLFCISFACDEMYAVDMRPEGMGYSAYCLWYVQDCLKGEDGLLNGC